MESLNELKEYFKGQVRDSYGNYSVGIWAPDEYIGVMSKRAFDAYNDSGKLSETELVGIIAKITGDDKKLIIKILRIIVPDCNLEWHHVSKGRSKKYSKEYFYNANQIIRVCESYDEIKESVERLILRVENAKLELPVLEKKLCEIESKAKTFTREKNIPDGFTTIVCIEMNGKYGWFESNRKYNLPEYYSGYIFETKEEKEAYRELKNRIETLKELIYG